MKRLLALDVGNTSITVGLFRGSRLVARGRIATPRPGKAGALARPLRALLRRLPAGAVDDVIVASVVPHATAALRRLLLALLKRRPLIVGRDLRVPVKNRYRVPSQVGQDRLVNAAAAFHLYGGPAIVVDFGTTVTVDLVSGKGEYLGGAIAPGMEISLEALVCRAALLPRISMNPPRELLGRDTRQSMRSGLFYGYGALCDGLVSGLRRRYAPGATVIATGGHAALVRPYCRSVQVLRPDLTLQGLRLTYQKNRKKS